LLTQSFQRYLGLHWTFGPVKVELLPDQITFYWTKKKLTQFKCNILFSCIFIYVSPVFNFIMPIFTKVIIFAIFCMSCVVALIVIQPFVIGQPLYVKFMCLSIFLMLLRFLPLVVTFRVFPFQTLPGIAPATYPSPNILITTNYCLK
jgi:hypothetical protein